MSDERKFELNKLQRVALKACLQAGNEIMKVYQSEDFGLEYKKDNSPLTKADLRANEVINKLLINTNIPIISEENKQLPYEERSSWKRCWIVDPLDGTKEFVKKSGEFTVNIALIELGKPILGVIYIPVWKQIYLGDVESLKAFKISRDEICKTEEGFLSLNNIIKPKNNKELIRVAGSKSHMNPETDEYIKSLQEFYNRNVEIVSLGSSLKFCLLAEGEVDVYPRFAPTMEWDSAAGHAICNAVGLKVIDESTKKEISYNRENLVNNSFVASRFE